MPTLELTQGLARTNTVYYMSIHPSRAVPMKCNLVLMLREFKMHLFVLHMARRSLQHTMYAPSSIQMFWYKFARFFKSNHCWNLRGQLLSPLGRATAHPISNTPVLQSPGMPVYFGVTSSIVTWFLMIYQCQKMFAECMICSLLHR